MPGSNNAQITPSIYGDIKYMNQRISGLELNGSSSGGNGSGVQTGGLVAEYYDNLTLTGNLLERSIKTKIDFTNYIPNNAPTLSPYSVRIVGWILPTYSEDYKFYTSSDDGVRVWINNVKVVDNWTDNPANASGTVTLVENTWTPIAIEHYTTGTIERLLVEWESFHTARGQIPTIQMGWSSSGGSVTTPGSIAPGTVGGVVIQDGGITADHIQAGTIQTYHLDAHTITADLIAAGAIQTYHLDAQIITADKIAANAITTDSLQANSVTATKIAADSITTNHLQAGSVTANKIAAFSIEAIHIAAETITSDLIQAGTITADLIAAGTITATQIAANTITATNIAANTITGDRIAANTITSSNIASGTITGSEIAGSTITASNMNVSSLSSLTANMGTLTAGTITGGTIQTDVSPNARVKLSTVGMEAFDTSNTRILFFDQGTGNLSLKGTITTGSVVPVNVLQGTILSSNIDSSSLANVQFPGSNLLDNSSFEDTASTIWTATNSTLAYSTTNPRLGATDARLTSTAANGSNISLNLNVSVAVVNSTSYAFSAYVRSDVTSRSARVKIEWRTAADAVISTDTGSNVSTTTTDWSARPTVIATSPSNAGFARVYVDFLSVNNGEVHRVDTVQLEQGTVVSGYAPKPGEISANSIGSTQIIDGSLTGTDIGNATITATNIANNTITAGQIANGTITSTQIATNTITASNIANGTITATQLSLGVGGGNYLNNSSFENTADVSTNYTPTNATLAYTTSQFRYGANSRQVTMSGTGVTSVGTAFSYPLVVGAKYTASGYFRPNTTARNVYVSIEWRTAADAVISTTDGTQVTEVSGSWVRATVTGTAPATTAKARIYWRWAVSAAAEIHYLDALQLEEADLASSYAPRPDEILPLTITATEIANDTITATQIAVDAVTASEIAPLTITASEIANTTITAAKIVALTITANEIAANTITGGKIAANTITASNIQALTITANEIAAATITGAKIAANTITASNLVANTITAGQIAANTITATEIAADAITTSELAANSVTAAKIVANTITAAQIAAGTITATQIAASTITGANIAANTIAASNIIAGTITATEIAAGTITGVKIAANTITAANIAASTITATQIASGTITALLIAANTITADKIALGTFSDNLIPNTSFEQFDTSNVPTGWYPVESTGSTLTYISSTDDSKEGIRSVKIGNGSSINLGIGSPVIAVTPGDKIVARAYVRHSNGNGTWYMRIIEKATAPSNGIYITSADRTSFTDLVSNQANTNIQGAVGTWFFKEFTYTVPAGIFFINLSFYNWTSSTGYLYVDGVELKEQLAGTTIQAGAITTNQIAANTITAANIAASTITTTQILANTILGGDIAAQTITATNIATGTITATQIAASTITGGLIAAGTITASDIASATITTTQIAAATITGGNIAAGTITGTNIAAITITAANIAADTITAAQIASNTITSAEILAGTITATQIAANTITGTQIAANTITADKISIGVAGGNMLANSSYEFVSPQGYSDYIGDETYTRMNFAGDNVYTNLLLNPNVEVDAATYVNFSGSSGGGPAAAFVRSTTWSYVGSASMRYTVSRNDVTATSLVARTATGTAGIPVQPNTTYSARIIANVISGTTTGGPVSACRIDWYDAGGASITSVTPTSTTGTGVKVLTNVAATSPANAAFAAVSYRTQSSGGSVTDTFDVYIDGWTLVAGSTLPDDFISGDQPGCRWLGTPHNSKSQGIYGLINKVVNPSFETNATGWVQSGCTIARITGSAANGSALLQITGNGVNNAQVLTSAYPSAMPIVANATYTASAYFKANTTVRTCRVDLIWVDASGATISASSSTSTSDATGTWTQKVVTGVAPSNAFYARVDCIVFSPANAELHYIDKVSLIRTSDTTLYFDGNDGNADWQGTANNSESILRVQPQNGNYCVQIDTYAIAGDGHSAHGITHISPTIVPADTEIVSSVWVLAPVGKQLTISSRAYDASGNYLQEGLGAKIHTGTGVWTRVATDPWTWTSDAFAPGIQITTASTNSFTYFIDSTQVEIGDIPTAWTPWVDGTVIDGGTLTAPLIRTAESGARVILDSSGLTAYDISNNITAQITGSTGTFTGYTFQSGSAYPRVIMNANGILLPTTSAATQQHEDLFTGITSGSNLNGRTETTGGGVWTTSGSTAGGTSGGDFLGGSNVITRTGSTVTDTGGGRYAVINTTSGNPVSFTDMEVQASWSQTTNASNSEYGVIARWTDASNHVVLKFTTAPAGTSWSLRLIKVVGGTSTTIKTITASDPGKSIIYSNGTTYFVRLRVRSDGTYVGQWLNASLDPLVTFSGTDSVFATGGSLQSGKGGIQNFLFAPGTLTVTFDNVKITQLPTATPTNYLEFADSSSLVRGLIYHEAAAGGITDVLKLQNQGLNGGKVAGLELRGDGSIVANANFAEEVVIAKDDGSGQNISSFLQVMGAPTSRRVFFGIDTISFGGAGSSSKTVVHGQGVTPAYIFVQPHGDSVGAFDWIATFRAGSANANSFIIDGWQISNFAGSPAFYYAVIL